MRHRMLSSWLLQQEPPIGTVINIYCIIFDILELNLNDAVSLFLQGEKYFAGFGVPRSFDIAFKRYEVITRF